MSLLKLVAEGNYLVGRKLSGGVGLKHSRLADALHALFVSRIDGEKLAVYVCHVHGSTLDGKPADIGGTDSPAVNHAGNLNAGFSRKIVEFAVSHQIPIFPGVCTPTELMLLLEYDLPVAKFFPAAQCGGLATIKALAAPFPQLKFMPTGGINAKNVREYLEFPKVVACGGSWMVKSDLINTGDFDAIRRLSQEAVELVSDL